jgi:formate dehydrogenase accessory protein FdhD
MNQPIKRDIQAPVVCPTKAICKVGGIEEERFVCVAEETPVAFRYDGFSHAVMMATPEHLHDFAFGFSRSEGIIETHADIRDISIDLAEEGATIDISLTGNALHLYLANRRIRRLKGHTSCGLCGVEDLSDVRRPTSRLRPAPPLSAEAVRSAVTTLRQWQPLSRHTRGAHASAWVTRDGALRVVREDVGRHNSLDKLIGALLRTHVSADDGFCLITSRCSLEMVQKAAAAGIATLVSAGAPTGLAVRFAETVGLSLHSLSRDGEPLQFMSVVGLENDR